ncbi:hypothetical protein BRPE64_DCDS03230 (plasmid) [Caballeronia insecticola]|uniref:Uncharacterized protein n=1 Tax=Caballeronia insecticola TaxID=758793 RepID=R4WRT5_9BURK|nr:hypothetical protein BRPE64_DCDS03230 [Caballeronia insecticola]
MGFTGSGRRRRRVSAASANTALAFVYGIFRMNLMANFRQPQSR